MDSVAKLLLPKTRVGVRTVVELQPGERPMANNDEVVVLRRPDLHSDFASNQIHGGGAPKLHADTGMTYQVVSIGPGAYEQGRHVHYGQVLEVDDICYANSWNGGMEFMYKRKKFQMFSAEDMMARLDRSEQRFPAPTLDTVITKSNDERMSAAIWGDMKGQNGKRMVIPTVDAVDGLAADEALDDPTRYVMEEVVAVGPGRPGDPPPRFKKGELVLLSKGHTTCDLTFKGKSYTLSPASHIRATIPDAL